MKFKICIYSKHLQAQVLARSHLWRKWLMNPQGANCLAKNGGTPHHSVCVGLEVKVGSQTMSILTHSPSLRSRMICANPDKAHLQQIAKVGQWCSLQSLVLMEFLHPAELSRHQQLQPPSSLICLSVAVWQRK